MLSARFQLPADSRAFTGRIPELVTLLELARPARADVSETVVISSIGGMGGVGKTALALAQGYADRAMKAYQEALDGARAIGNTYDEAYVLWGIGRCHARLGDVPAAVEALDAALTILRDLGVVETAAVEADLADIRTDGG